MSRAVPGSDAEKKLADETQTDDRPEMVGAGITDKTAGIVSEGVVDPGAGRRIAGEGAGAAALSGPTITTACASVFAAHASKMSGRAATRLRTGSTIISKTSSSALDSDVSALSMAASKDPPAAAPLAGDDDAAPLAGDDDATRRAALRRTPESRALMLM